MDPPLPVYLFNVVSCLRDKSAKGYPVKKARTGDVILCLKRLISQIVASMPMEIPIDMPWRYSGAFSRAEVVTRVGETTACAG